MPTDAELLKVYLADRDVPCSGCRYSLKGCVAEKCPECGEPFNLVVNSSAVPRLDLWLLRLSTLFFALMTLYSAAMAIQLCWESRNATVNWALFWERPASAVFHSAAFFVLSSLVVRSWRPTHAARREYHARTVRWFMGVFTGFMAMRLAVAISWMSFA